MTYTASDACVHKLMNFEDFREMVYIDGGGLFTIGYGRLCGKDEPPTTKEREAAWLKQRLVSICQWLNVNMPGLMQHQVDALCLLIYNIGQSAFASCDTFKLLKAHDPLAFGHWTQWIKDNKGNIEAGLVARRHQEVNLFIWGWS